MSVLRDLLRRRFRTLLTIMGIAIGVFTLVVLGAVAEKARMQTELVDEYRGGTITVVDDASGVSAFTLSSGMFPISMDAVDRIRTLDGVAEVLPQVALFVDQSALPIGSPPTVVGGFGMERLEDLTTIVDGRYCSETERGVTTLGADLAEKLEATTGDTVELRGQDFKVVGVMERTFIGALDQTAIVSLADARELCFNTMAEGYRSATDLNDLVLSATVIPEQGTSAEKLAEQIERSVENVTAYGPSDIRGASNQVVALLDVLLVAVGAIALLVGGLSVINTMIVAATERTHEVGIKRALGASQGRIARDVLAESAAIGLIGGAVGAAAGTTAAALIGAITTAETGMGLFAVTPRLLMASIAMALVLGLVGGVYPAWYAARIDPVDALAHE